MSTDDSPDAGSGYLRCPIPHGKADRWAACIRRRVGLLLSERGDLIEIVRETGTVADLETTIDGPPLLRRRDVFGARDWFVIDGDDVWYLSEHAGIGYPRHVRYGDRLLAGWRIERSFVGDGLLALVQAARFLKAQCAAHHLPWEQAASARG